VIYSNQAEAYERAAHSALKVAQSLIFFLSQPKTHSIQGRNPISPC